MQKKRYSETFHLFLFIFDEIQLNNCSIDNYDERNIPSHLHLYFVRKNRRQRPLTGTFSWRTMLIGCKKNNFGFPFCI